MIEPTLYLKKSIKSYFNLQEIEFYSIDFINV